MCRAIPSCPRKLSSMAGYHGPEKATPPFRDGGSTEARAVAPVEALGTEGKDTTVPTDPTRSLRLLAAANKVEALAVVTAETRNQGS
ncbi:hypothetical protein MUK42_37310 [Musa troglodytarum]|uniref:Uncharacterized protein n=1 Tax=Musa troglodytarum TaxID=320322 RepID=A0A9E7GQG0_9LILI|nr:hypothetical protein MUK42_37310 [Musa troglodytarum]